MEFTEENKKESKARKKGQNTNVKFIGKKFIFQSTVFGIFNNTLELEIKLQKTIDDKETFQSTATSICNYTLKQKQSH